MPVGSHTSAAPIDVEMRELNEFDEPPHAKSTRARLTSSRAAPEGGLGCVLALPPRPRRNVLRWLRAAFKPKPNATVASGDSGNATAEPRVVPLGCTTAEWDGRGYSTNEVNNRQYSLLTFLPLALLKQFRSFFNIFYLFLAFSQFVPVLKVGFLFTYLSPLALVVTLSLLKDALDELKRYRRDRAVNREPYERVRLGGDLAIVRSADIRVGDLLLLRANQRVPADCVLLWVSDHTGTTFVRTDQLDGETDWKLRYPLSTTRQLGLAELSRLRVNLRCEAPHQDIYHFVGVLDRAQGDTVVSEAIGLENTLWATCVVASGAAVAAVIHTGTDTRSAMNSTKPSTKRGLIERELNVVAFMCFVLLIILSLFLATQQRFHGDWPVLLVRFFVSMSAIIPISMRVNVDLARLWYSYDIYRDTVIAGTVARNTDLPEELGRLQYLFSDKTGTLTKNRMDFRVMQVGAELLLTDRDTARLLAAVYDFYGIDNPPDAARRPGVGSKQWYKEVQAVGEMVQAMVLCHNVNPVLPPTNDLAHGVDAAGITYQASSPDEVALVRFCSSLSVVLTERESGAVAFVLPNGAVRRCEIVKLFPFTSERKCMGVLLRMGAAGAREGDAPGEPASVARPSDAASYRYYMKGADVKMQTVVRPVAWLEECCQELAQVGLRTLVFAARTLTETQVQGFLGAYDAANAVLGEGRNTALEAAMRLLETDLTLLGVTGVEDELQDDVVMALETLGMCGIKVWVLTGDKVETAATIARSTRLVSRQGLVEYMLTRGEAETRRRLQQLQQQHDPAFVGNYALTPWTLILDGDCLAACLQPGLAELFVSTARSAYSVVVARCSPTQKAAVVSTMRRHTRKDVCMAAIGDGGNDVAMILAADVGIGIEGVEGRQASMAADFSITRFANCLRLIMWHGRNAYRRTCRLSQFIMHRGMVYSVVQAAFSTFFSGISMSLFNGYLLMGYSTIFTMAPAFALVLDEDFTEADINEYPQLYKELVKGRSMNARTFLQWAWISFFQGGVLMYAALELFSEEMFQIVTITYTALLLTELAIIGGTAHLRTLWRQRRSHLWLFVAAEAVSLLLFFLAVLILPDTFDRSFFFSWSCWWRVAVCCLVSIGPLAVIVLILRYLLFSRQAMAMCFNLL